MVFMQEEARHGIIELLGLAHFELLHEIILSTQIPYFAFVHGSKEINNHMIPTIVFFNRVCLEGNSCFVALLELLLCNVLLNHTVSN